MEEPAFAGAYSTVVIIYSLVVAAWALVHLITGKAVSKALTWAVWGVAAAFAVLAVLGIVAMFGATQNYSSIEFLGYLLLSPLIPVAALWWNRGDESRAASGIYLVVCLVMPVLVVRIGQVWMGSSG